MIKRIVLVVFSLLVFGCLAWGADKSYVGTVSCAHCGAMHATPSADAAECVEKCVTAGASYVLVSEGKVYKLDAQAKFKGLGGKSVKVTGSLKGDTLKVTQVTEAPGKS